MSVKRVLLNRRAFALLSALILTPASIMLLAIPAKAATNLGTVTWTGSALTNGNLTGAAGDVFNFVNASGTTVYIVNGTGVAEEGVVTCTVTLPAAPLCDRLASQQGNIDIVSLGTLRVTDAANTTLATITITSASGSSGVVASVVEVLPSPVVQQFGKPASGTCDAAAPASLNWSGVASGGWGESWAQWMNSGKGGAVCTRTLVYSTSQSRWIVG